MTVTVLERMARHPDGQFVTVRVEGTMVHPFVRITWEHGCVRVFQPAVLGEHVENAQLVAPTWYQATDNNGSPFRVTIRNDMVYAAANSFALDMLKPIPLASLKKAIARALSDIAKAKK